MQTDTQTCRVLVVDDEPSVCQSVDKVLSRRGHQVEQAQSVADAIDVLERGASFDLVLADLMMPHVGGLELIRLVTDRWPGLPVVVITGYASIASAVEATRLGAIDYLAKPFTPEELAHTVGDALARRRDRRKASPPAQARGAQDPRDPQMIDVDLPFDEAEVAAATSPAYVVRLTRSDLVVVDFCALGRGDRPVVGRWPKVKPGARRILAVDDEAVVVHSIRKLMSRRGFVVDEAFSGYAALRQVMQSPYDLVLLDMRMPDTNGLDLLPRIKKQQPDVPVVIVTGYASIETAVEAIQRGAADYVPKPFTPDELLAVATRVLQQAA